jgi:hypothetical protein
MFKTQNDDQLAGRTALAALRALDEQEADAIRLVLTHQSNLQWRTERARNPGLYNGLEET